jgi:hypothetical protein
MTGVNLSKFYIHNAPSFYSLSHLLIRKSTRKEANPTMLEAKEPNQEQLSPDSLQLDGICICCEALTKLLVQKGVISWDELLTVAKAATIERKK